MPSDSPGISDSELNSYNPLNRMQKLVQGLTQPNCSNFCLDVMVLTSADKRAPSAVLYASNKRPRLHRLC